METHPGDNVTDAGLAAEWGAHIQAHQAPGFEWDPQNGYSADQLKANATATQTTGEGVDFEVVEPAEGRKPGEREFGPATRTLTAAQIVALGKPVVHSTEPQPKGDNSITHHVPGGIIDSM